METSKIRVMVMQNGQMKGLYHADLTYIDNIPYAVFKWETVPEGDPVPVARVRLDPRGLMKLPANSSVEYQYRAAIEDPRQPEF
ncbi:hypothetical protein NB646_07700 [Oxalobacter aliiformigenes]|uniref:Uncharacterized protein n=1 Tax=Oxalobacter aliiformigenes TaxID=2946593 RepID=A0A9E9LAG0_9BURK|nr:hypothetical protein [Oxalobacter aliiformigenes]WAV90726.1 hypothetical protein NB646_07700 [Oxalobacter aliiformigenes]